MATEQFHFILIDDSKLDCFIGEKIIVGTGRAVSCHTFMSTSAAFEHIQNSNVDAHRTIILVDIQMPLMTGFDFIEHFEKNIPEPKQSTYIINLLTSSVNQNDMIQSQRYKSVNAFLNKPIKKDVLIDLMDKLNS